MANRNKSRFINLRNFHNSLKGALIKESVKLLNRKPVKLFDISVGRMGDYHNWNKADIKYVFGVDPDKESIKEAENRLKEIKKRHYNKTFVNLAVGKITDEYFDVKFPRTQIFDIVSCQFTLHYFFKNQQMLDNALYRIIYTLKPGGYFIGTTIDGHLLNKKLIEHCGKMEKENYYKIEKKYNQYKKPFGNEYNFELYDVDKSGIYFKRESIEYLVSKQVLIQACMHFGLKLIKIQDFSESEIKHRMTEPEKDISHLYFSFIFQKI